MDHGYLDALAIILGLGLFVVLIFSKLRVPPLVGFLLVGILIGPHGLRLVADQRHVEVLAEVGVIILLFTIGVELSLEQFAKLGRTILLAGFLQVLVTVGAGAGAGKLAGLGTGTAILVGCVVALSSTAIVMRLLSERAETSTPQGRVSLSILIFQDLAIVPMMLVVPFLAGGGGEWAGIAKVMLKAVVVVAGVLLLARHVVPPILRLVVATRSRELFILSLVVICVGIAWITSKLELSLALGAFLAGLLVSESEYSHHTLSTILPFRDAFSSLFFVSIGMLLDVGFVVEHPLPVLGATVGILIGKAVITAAIALALGYNIRIAAFAGILLSQIGEFSFLLIHAGLGAGMLAGNTHQILLAAAVLTMAVTPLLLLVAPRVSHWVAHVGPAPVSGDAAEKGDHVVIVGYGLNGQNVARVLKHVKMPYIVMEINPETVRRLRRDGDPVMYADATHPEALHKAGIERARAAVVTIPDAASARRIVKIARDLNPRVHLIVRTQFVTEVAELYRLGANEVIPEEFETSIEIFSRVLQTYMVPRDVVDQLVREVRTEGYGMLRAQSESFRPVEGLRRLLGDVQFEIYRVSEASSVAGKKLSEAAVKSGTGALILAIHRNHVTTPNPPADWVLEVNDVALVLGSPESLVKAGELFRGGPS